MRFKKPIVALSTAALLALAACGGGGGDERRRRLRRQAIDQENLGNTGEAQDPDARGPGRDRGRRGGRHRHGADRHSV